MKNCLFSPEGAQTDSTITLVWENHTDSEYYLFINGKLNTQVRRTYYTVENLEPETTYEFELKLKSGESIGKCRVLTKPQGNIYNISDYGAVGDGKTINTSAIQTAIEACSENGIVYIPKGIFMTGAISLKSNMTLYVSEGAVLKGSPFAEDYPVINYRFEGIEDLCYSSLIDAYNVQNIVISGAGTIDANGAELKKNQLADNRGKRGRCVCIRNSNNIYLNNLTLRQSPAWCLHTIYSQNITLDNIEIHTKYDENNNPYKDIINGDGFDPDSCKNVYVLGCTISSQDDCIAIKSGKNEEGRAIGVPCENILITNCKFLSGFGVAVGSEMSGDVRNVLVESCVFKNTHSIASIKPPRGRGGIVENIKYKNCTLDNSHPDANIHDCEWFRGAINVDMFYSCKDFDIHTPSQINEATPKINKIIFENIDIVTKGGTAIYLAGLPESRIENVILKDVSATGIRGMELINVNNISFDNVSVKSFKK